MDMANTAAARAMDGYKEPSRRKSIGWYRKYSSCKGNGSDVENMVAARVMGDVEKSAAARAIDGYKEHSRCKSSGWIENRCKNHGGI